MPYYHRLTECFLGEINGNQGQSMMGLQSCKTIPPPIIDKAPQAKLA